MRDLITIKEIKQSEDIDIKFYNGIKLSEYKALIERLPEIKKIVEKEINNYTLETKELDENFEVISVDSMSIR